MEPEAINVQINAVDGRESYDLLLAGRRVGRVLWRRTELRGARPVGEWTLFHDEGQYVLAVGTIDEALARARRMVAARLTERRSRP